MMHALNSEVSEAISEWAEMLSAAAPAVHAQISVSITVRAASQFVLIVCLGPGAVNGRCRVGKAKKNGRVIVSRGAYATPADFKRVFTEDVNSLYLLSLLLTGSPDKAERCFVEGIGEATKGNYVFKEWARSWARRTIIQSAIRLIAPMGNCKTIGRNADLARGMNKIPMILHSEVRAILDLAPLERFVFVMSVLERYSDNDCSILLGCARREIAIIRARAMQQLGRSNDPAASSSDNARYANTAMITTPLIAQYFAPSAWAATVSGQ